MFRVEGSRGDPEFERACGVVKGLENLYGDDRYILHAVPQEPGDDTLQQQHQQREQQQHSPKGRRRSWLPLWLCGSSSRASSRSTTSSALSSEPAPPPHCEGKSRPRAVLCSIDVSPAAAAVAAGNKVQQQQQDDDRTNGEYPRVGKDPAFGDDGVGVDVEDTSVTIGGVEELLEFVRSSVLAGPRPFSFAVHEQSLR